MEKIAAIAVVALLSLAGPAKAATIILDGDFANSAPTFTTFSSGSSFGPWAVTSGSVDLISSSYWQSPTVGGGSVDLDGSNPGSIQQTFTAPAGNYVLTFSLSGNPQGPTDTKSLQVDVGGKTQNVNYTLTGANSTSNMLYTTDSVDFTSTGAPITLAFLSLDSNPSSAFGPVIGGVSVSAVPLPASLPLFGAAMLGLFFYARQRSAKV